jgi:hypothetical protein
MNPNNSIFPDLIKIEEADKELRNRILLRLGRTIAGRSDCPKLIADRILQRITQEEIQKN